MSEEMKSLAICYLIVRNDLASLGMGKGCAQSHHNGVVFATYMLTSAETQGHRELYNEWAAQGAPQPYGTVLTLGADGEKMRLVSEFAAKAGFPSVVVTDKTYPIIDGKVCHQIEIDTCAYVFGRKDELSALLGQFNLFPIDNPASGNLR